MKMISSGNSVVVTPRGQQFGDTTYTKVFVGGLAWETQKETMRKYFEQFGEILEAVVITDKNTGRSKGYGFVTFREPDAAMRACADAAPIIDGRRANCNLASLGVQRTSWPLTPQHGGSRFRAVNSFRADFQGGLGTAYPSSATFPHYAAQQGMAYNIYGYSPYLTDYSYLTSYYNVYGGRGSQYPIYGGGAGTIAGGVAGVYPYFQIGQGTGYGTQGQGYGHFPQLLYYTATARSGGLPSFGQQQYGASVSVAALPTATTSGVTMALPATAIPSPTSPYRLLPVIPTFTPSTGSAEPSSA